MKLNFIFFIKFCLILNLQGCKLKNVDTNLVSTQNKICKLLFNFSNSQLEDDQKDIVDDRYNKSPREIMQYIGTDIMQFELQKFIPSIGRLLWTRSLLDSINNNDIVISDMRFKHEAEEVLKYDPKALIIIIKRSCNDSDSDIHISENEIESIPYQYTIYNDSSLEKLYKSIDDIITSSQILSSTGMM